MSIELIGMEEFSSCTRSKDASVSVRSILPMILLKPKESRLQLPPFPWKLSKKREDEILDSFQEVAS